MLPRKDSGGKVLLQERELTHGRIVIFRKAKIWYVCGPRRAQDLVSDLFGPFHGMTKRVQVWVQQGAKSASLFWTILVHFSVYGTILPVLCHFFPGSCYHKMHFLHPTGPNLHPIRPTAISVLAGFQPLPLIFRTARRLFFLPSLSQKKGKKNCREEEGIRDRVQKVQKVQGG